MFTLGDLANRNPPRLHAYDRFAARFDAVELHPAWHELLSRLVAEGLLPSRTYDAAFDCGALTPRVLAP
jgi:hypothetical protein